MGNRTAGRAFDRRIKNIHAGLLTLFLVALEIAALYFVVTVLPPYAAAWRSHRMVTRAQSLMERGKAFEAITVLKHAAALDPKNKYAFFNLGVLELVVNGDAAAAEEQFRRATEADPNFARAFFNLGTVQLFHLQKHRLARDNLARATRLDPTYAPAFAALGLAHEALGEYGAARDAYDQYLKLNPKGPWAPLVTQHRYAIAGLPTTDDLPRQLEGYDDVFELVAVGDISLARGVNKDFYTGRSVSPLTFVAPLVSRAAVAFGNLESPLTKRNTRVPTKGPAGGEIFLKGNPDFTFILTEAGFDVLSLANNHIMDYGPEGLADTIHYVEREQIKHVGAGADLAAALNPAEVDVDGFKIHFLAFNAVPPAEYNAAAGKPGVAPLDEGVVTSAVAASAAKANLVVASLHWGDEGMFYPSAEQKRLAHKIVDAGADVVVGHHPHVLQGVETYEGAIIAYSLGNFLFDTRFPERRYSTLLTVEISRSKGVLGYRLIPIYIVGTEPTVAGGTEGAELMEFVLMSASGKNVRLGPTKP